MQPRRREQPRPVRPQQGRRPGRAPLQFHSLDILLEKVGFGLPNVSASLRAPRDPSGYATRLAAPTRCDITIS